MRIEKISDAIFHIKDAPERDTAVVASVLVEPEAEAAASPFAATALSRTSPALMVVPSDIVRMR